MIKTICPLLSDTFANIPDTPSSMPQASLGHSGRTAHRLLDLRRAVPTLKTTKIMIASQRNGSTTHNGVRTSGVTNPHLMAEEIRNNFGGDFKNVPQSTWNISRILASKKNSSAYHKYWEPQVIGMLSSTCSVALLTTPCSFHA